MLIEYPYAKRYLLTAIEATPIVVARLLAGVSDEEADFRFDPERFTIREGIARLADWDEIYLARMERICAEDVPVLPDIDEAQVAIDHDYASAKVAEQVERLHFGRVRLVAFLQGRSAAEWARVGNRPEIGLISLEFITTTLPLHDAYHEKAFAEAREAFRTR